MEKFEFSESLNKTGIVSLKNLKSSFTKKFPTSTFLPLILSLPDEVEGEELIGAVGVWLNILDMERNKNMKREIEKEAKK